MSKKIYLDYAAATPLDPGVFEAMKPYLEAEFFNPSAAYLAARQVRRDLEGARAKVAAILGAKTAEIIFTAGATEANNLAIEGIARCCPAGEILISRVEHDSVLAPARRHTYREIPVDKQGLVDPASLGSMIKPSTVLISIMLVNNELGTVQPLRQAAVMVEKIRDERRKTGNKTPLYIHTDAAKAANWLDLHVARLGVDLMSINGGKIYGPKQTGALFIKAGVKLEPLIVGGGQEFGIRSGTENVAGFIGLAEALAGAQERRLKETDRVRGLRDLFIDGVNKISKGAVVNGSRKHTAPHIISVTFPGADNERLMMALDEKGIMAAVGSACSASSQEPSHVLSAIGLSKDDARSTLRFSLGRQTSEDEIAETLKIMGGCLIESQRQSL